MLRLPRLALPLVLAACAATHGPSPDGGAPVPDAGPRTHDDGPRRDGGALPGPLCARAAAASPLGLIAMARAGRDLLALGAGGELRPVHRLFGERALRGELTWRGWQATRATVVALASAEPECGRPSCPRLGEVVLLDAAAGTHVFEVEEAADGGPFLAALSEDGLPVVSVRETARGESVMLALDPVDGGSRAFPPEVRSYGGEGPDEDGWRPVRIVTPDPSMVVPAFARLGDESAVPVPGGVPAARTWGAAWVFLDASTGDLVVARSGGSERRIPLGPGSGGWHLQRVAADHAELWRFREPVALVDLARETRIDLPSLLAPGDDLGQAHSRFGTATYVASGSSRRVLRVALATGDVAATELPADARPFVTASYCGSPPLPLADGRFAVALRRAGGISGAYVEQVGGALALVGRPLHDVLHARLERFSETWVIQGVSGNNTFCPHRAPWPEPAPDDALLLDSIQLVRGEVSLALEDGEHLLHVDPTGTCALRASVAAGVPVAFDLVDLERGERAEIERADSLLGVPPVWFTPF
ncbi:MAG: hypothetical protein ACFCGT_04915 [Sandaracinaceae bacterium]